jgi:hypothetical protein
LLDDAAEKLGLYEGIPVILYYSDLSDEFEYDAVLGHANTSFGKDIWMALINDGSFRRIR